MINTPCISIIEKRFSSKNALSYIVDVHSYLEMNDIISHFSVGNTIIISASDYCKNDELPRLDNLYDVVSRKSGNIIVTELTSFLRFNGENELKTQLSNILGLQTTGRVVFLTFCCSEMLKISDPRLKERIFISNIESKKMPKLIFVNKDMPIPSDCICCNGVHSVSHLIETENHELLYIMSQKRKSSYPSAMYIIKDLGSAYDILCQKDSSTHNFDSSLGTEEQWTYALSLFELNSSWEEAISSVFGSYKNLEFVLPNYNDFEKEKKWLYFLALKMFGTSNNKYLNMVAESSCSHNDFIRQMFRTLLSCSETDKSFSMLYNERKKILKYFGKYVDEVEDYCKMSKLKAEKEIYYLTDLSQLEKEYIIAFLDKYSNQYSPNDIQKLLSIVYPDLYYYLSPYNFKNKFLDDYFQQYKYQKVVNKVFPEFEAIVEEQAIKRDFSLILEPRTAIFDSIDKANSQLYFMDAMGVEYLGFILAKCHQKGLNANVKVCYSELPSLTCFNKEFVQVYEELGLPVFSVGDIDEIKHHAKYGYNYLESNLPTHLIRELAIIDETLDRIRAKLGKEECKKVIMAADHGASRLAVISEKENKWEMSSKGEHSGRCCPKTDIDSKPDCSTEERGFWVIANYDRFKGGRKASVEVHGGATLEEVVVPVIELTIKNSSIEVHIVNPVITVSFRKKAVITIFSKTKLHDVSIKVNEKYYDAIANDSFYTVEMPDIKKKGDYTADVYSSGNLIVSGLSFTVEKEGSQENKLF